MRGKASKTVDIRLYEERFYYPDDKIQGVVIVHPKSPTKTNHIVVRFSGQIIISVKEKETIDLFSKTKILPVSGDSGKSSHVLDAKQHSFPFEFEVPNELPSSMEFGKRKVRVKYILTAIHDRPMVPESLCSKVSYGVPILELVDVTKVPFIKPQEKSIDILLPGAKYNKKCQTLASMPRFGYTRGEIVSLKIIINHFEAFSKPNGLEVELVRTAEIRTQRNTTTTEDILKAVKQDVKIIGPYNFSQLTTCQLLVPTSTPPTIRFKDKTLHIHYKIRVKIQLGKSGNDTVSTLEMPFVVGTWPRADIPIDDDDDDELIQLLGETMRSDDEDDDDLEDSNSNNNTDLDRRDANYPSSHHKRYSTLSTSSATTLTVQQRNNLVGRSDSTQSRISHKSVGSVSSWRSSQSIENNSALPRTTSSNLTPVDHHQNYHQQQQHHGYGRSSTFNDMIYSNVPLNRSSSTPDLVANPTPSYYGQCNSNISGGSLQHQNGYPLHDGRSLYYDEENHRGISVHHQHGIPNYAGSPRQQYIPYGDGNNNFERVSISSPSSSLHSPYQPNRIGSEEYRTTMLPTPPQPQVAPPLIDDVPTRVLQPIPSTPTNPVINRFRTTQTHQDGTNSSISKSCSRNHYPPSGGDNEAVHTRTTHLAGTFDDDDGDDVDDDDDDSDDGDLLGIIEKKKKQAARKMRQKQRTMYTVAE